MAVTINGSGVVTGLASGNTGVGKILQVVNATYSTQTSNSTNVYADTGLTATITPTLATSKILVVVSVNGCSKQGNTGIGTKLLRGATVLMQTGELDGYTNSAAQNDIGSITANYLDSPATTSATTYKMQFNSWQNIASTVVQDGSTARSTMTLMEVAA